MLFAIFLGTSWEESVILIGKTPFKKGNFPSISQLYPVRHINTH